MKQPSNMFLKIWFSIDKVFVMYTVSSYRYICSECGCVHEDKNGMCIYGHDNWMELGGESILPSQVETFEGNLGTPISMVFRALSGDEESLAVIYEAHKRWLENRGIQMKKEDVISH